MALSVASIGTFAGANNAVGNDAPAVALTVGASVGDVVAGWVWSNSAVTLTSITDSKGNTWTIRAAYVVGTERMYAVDCLVGTALTTSDTINPVFSGTGGRRFCNFVKIGGAATSYFDKYGTGATGTSTTPSITTDTPTQADSVILAGLYVTSPAVTITEDADYTAQADATVENRKLHMASRIISAAAADTYNPTISASQTWEANWIIYKAAGAAPPAADDEDLLLLGVG